MLIQPTSQLTHTDALPTERLHTLYQIIQRLNSAYELPDLLAFLLERVLDDTGGQRGYVLLAQEGPDAPQGEPCLEVKAVAGNVADLSQVETDVLRYVSRSVVRDVLQQGEPRVIEDLRQDARYQDGSAQSSSHFKWRSILAIPLKVADRLIGLMYIEHPGRNAFPDPNLDFLSAFAGQAAVAVDRAQQNQRRIDELERLNEVSRSVVRVLDLDEVLTRILREATHLLQVETGSVLLLESTSSRGQAPPFQGANLPDDSELVFRVSVQEGRPVHISHRLKMGQGVAGWVAQHRQALLVRDVHDDPRWYGEVEAGFCTRSILCVPLQIDNHIIGVLQALNKKGPVGFTERDLTLLSAFATSATVAIENARLFAEARQVRELQALNELSAVLSSTLELKTVLQTGLVKALQVMRAEAGLVSLVDRSTGDLVVAASRGWRGQAPADGTPVRAGKQLLSWVASSSRIWANSQAGHGLQAAIDDLRDEKTQVMTFTPLRAGGRLVGVLSGMSYTPREFTPDDIDLLSAIGGMFGVAVENARLYEEVRANLLQISYFNEVGSGLTASLNLERVLQIVMEGVTSLMGAERVSIFLINEGTSDLMLEYSVGGHESIRLPAPWSGIVGWIASHGTPVIANDVRQDPRFLSDIDAATHFDTRSILGAPLKLDDRVIGVIEVLNKLDGPFTEQDRSLLVGFSKWAAIALHNAHLYRQLNDAKERLSSVEAVAVMGDMALNLTHELNNRISIIAPTLGRIHSKCESELTNPYLNKKLEVIRDVAEQSITIIRRIREPFEVTDEEAVDVSMCLEQALDGFQAKPGIRLIKHFQADLPPVVASTQKLRQAFCHIIGNAIEAMGDKGQLLLSTRRRLDGLVEVIISDDGPGIPPSIREHLFELSVTTKASTGGLGLGLWWTRMYIARLGGQVKLHSTPGRGTVVSIRLPAITEELPS
jgi:GAF domain-containing protein